MTLCHLVCALHGLLKSCLRSLGMFSQTHGHIDHIGPPGLCWIQPCAIALDDAAAFQFLHPTQASRWGQANRIGQLQITHPAIKR